MRKFVKDHILFLPILVFFIFLLFINMGTPSPSYDELWDDSIVDCYETSGNVLDCYDDITQARLPHYIHTAARIVSGSMISDSMSDHLVSIFFAVCTLIALYYFAKKEFNTPVALLTSSLFATSIPILAAGRMVLTHSNIIFIAVTLASMICFYYYLKRERDRYLIFTALFFGLSVASNIMAVVNIIFFIILYLVNGKYKKDQIYGGLIFIFISTAVFFLGSLFHFDWSVLKEVYIAILGVSNVSGGEIYRNYLGLGTPYAPWFFSIAIFVIKISPVLAVLYFISPFIFLRDSKDFRQKFLISGFLFILFYLFTKSAIFRYDAPHHQTFFYPLVYLTIAYLIYIWFQKIKTKLYKVLLVVLVCLIFIVQIYYIIIFLPNPLFYGIQYGDRFIGQFQGPASINCQNFQIIKDQTEELLMQGESVLLFTYCFSHSEYFTAVALQDRMDRGKKYDYVVSTIMELKYNLYNQKGIDMRNNILDNCYSIFSSSFPMDKEVYFIYECPDGLSSPYILDHN